MNAYINSQVVKIVIIVIKTISGSHQKIKNEGLGKDFSQELVYTHLSQELKLVKS